MPCDAGSDVVLLDNLNRPALVLVGVGTAVVSSPTDARDLREPLAVSVSR